MDSEIVEEITKDGLYFRRDSVLVGAIYHGNIYELYFVLVLVYTGDMTKAEQIQFILREIINNDEYLSHVRGWDTKLKYAIEILWLKKDVDSYYSQVIRVAYNELMTKGSIDGAADAYTSKDF